MELKELREKAGLKQSELAAISGVNLRSLQDYEQGHKSLLSAKGETLLRLGMSLGCTVEDILGGTRVEFENNDESVIPIEESSEEIVDSSADEDLVLDGLFIILNKNI